MQIALKTKNRKLTDAEEDLIRKKVGRLPRYLDNLSDAEVIVGEEHTRRGADQQVVQLTVRANGTLLRAEERDGEMPAALDMAIDKIERRIERFKGRHGHIKKGRTALGEAVSATQAGANGAGPALAEEEVEAPTYPIVRTKEFPVHPMQREDAVEQMEMLGHDFFVFWDADTKRMAVLYRRQDGDYGLLEPELA